MQMILNLASNDFLRLTHARGTTVEVLDGRVWITEAGSERDAFVSPGMRYDVASDGLVVVGKEGGPAARIAVRAPMWRLLWERAVAVVTNYAAELQEQRTVRELERLSDHSLRDIGLARDEIRAAVRERSSL
jgi:uncharacterized protein YjiS (DUF1127 family)